MNTQTETVLSYLTFRLGDEIFAANVDNVLEILEIPKITKVPRAPEFMRGVINLRGSVLPVIDTRTKFGLPKLTDTVNTCIIVMNINMEGQTIAIGAVADEVHEVKDMDDAQMQQPPSIGSKYKSEFITGMVKLNDQFIMVLDLDKVFSTDEVVVLKELTDKPVSAPTEKNEKKSTKQSNKQS